MRYRPTTLSPVLQILVVAAVASALAVSMGSSLNGPAVPSAFDGCTDDPYEDDDWCTVYGLPPIGLGETQSHLHCDEDWLHFRPVEGARYVIETSNLTGGADTVLELWLGDSHCQSRLLWDDNGGQGLASRIEWEARGTHGEVDTAYIRVGEAGDLYGEGKGYDVSLGCLDRCRTWVVPEVSRRDGTGSDRVQTDLWVFNPGVAEIVVDLVFTPTGGDAVPGRLTSAVVVPPGQMVLLEDVLRTRFDLASALGWLELDAHAAELVATARIWSGGSEGTVGHGVVAFPRHYATSAFTALFPLEEAPPWDTSLGVCEMAGRSTTIELTLRDAAGETLGSRQLALPAFGHHRIDDLAEFFGVATVVEAHVEVTADGFDRLFPYVVKVDSRSTDTVIIPRTGQYGWGTRVVPAAASSPGAYGTWWRTDLWMANLYYVDQTVEVAFLPSGESWPGWPYDATYEIPAGGLLSLPDIVAALGGSGSGALMVRPRYADFFLTSRTVSEGASGVLGQAIPSFSPLEQVSRADGPVTFLGVESSAEFRTNVGWVRVDSYDSPGQVDVRLYGWDGTLLGRRSFDIDRERHRQINDVFAALGVEGRSNCRIELEVVNGWVGIIGYASVVDNRSSDATFIHSLPFADPGSRGIILDRPGGSR